MSCTLNDLELVELAVRGDREATAVLVDRALPVVRGFAGRLAGPGEEGDALAQEAFVAALERLEAYRGEAGFTTWVCGIVLRRHADNQRRRAAERRLQAKIAAARPAPESDPAADRDGIERLWQLVAELPPAQQAVLVARAAGESAAEAAVQLGLTDNAFRVRLHRARQALRKLLLARYPDWFGEMNYAAR